jgi:hypothetical protein
MNFRPLPALPAIVLAAGSMTALAETMEEQIARARSAAPSYISDDATIVVDGEVVAEGSNGWTCMPDTFPDDKAPMCNDSEWMEMLTAFGSHEEFTADRIGISYMLQGEPKGSGVSNSDPYRADHASAEDYVETGPHLMIIVPKELLKGITDDPGQGGPYVMWKDTPYAHIMIPVTE